MNTIDPVSHTLGQLQASMEALRTQQMRAEAAADARHGRVMTALEGLQDRVSDVETTVKGHKDKLEVAEELVKSVDRLKERGGGALMILALLWAGVVAVAAWFKTELVRWVWS